jgi:hypothetical protein
VDDRHMNDRPVSKVPYLFIAAAFLFLAFFFLRAGMERVLTVVPDDASYYFKIAENAGGGEGLTFDRINRTNGFQPLWLAVLVPVYRAYRGTPETMCRIVLLLQLVILALAALVLNAALARFFSKRTVLASLLLFLFFVFVPAANGMESAVLVLFLSLSFYGGASMDIFGRRDPKRELVFGILLGLVVLSRLDMVFLPLVVVAASFASALRGGDERRAGLARTLFVSAGAAAVVLPYLAYNEMSFGAVMPISGLLKSSFPRLSDPAYALSTLGKRGWAGLLMAAAYAAYSLVRFRSTRSGADGLRYYRAAMTAMACAILLHFIHALFFMKWAVFSWHYVPYVLFGAVAICEPVERFLSPPGSKRARAAYRIAVAAIVAAGCLAAFRGLSRPLDRAWCPAAYAAARWARENTDTDAIFAMKDAGTFGYFSERRVINLDGVVNNLEYQAALRERNLRGYLAIKGVGFVVQHAFWDRPDVTKGEYEVLSTGYRSHLYECESDSLSLPKSDEVYRSRRYFDGPYETVFVIWKFRA